MSIRKLWERYKFPATAIFFTLIGVGLRIRCVLGRGIWTDENLQMQLAAGPLQPFWQRLSYNVELSCFPGEYLLTWSVGKMLGISRWSMEIPHALAMLLSFYLLYLVCRRLFKTVWGFVITFALFVFNSQLIFHSLEIRYYSILIMLSLAVFYLSDRVSRGGERLSVSQRFLISAFFVLVSGFHAYGFFMVGLLALFFALCDYRQWKFPEGYLLRIKFYAPVFIVGGGLFLWFATGATPLDRSSWRNPWMDTFEYIPNPALDPAGFLKSVFGNLIGFKLFYPLLLGTLIPFLLPVSERLKQIGFFLLLVVLPIELLMLASYYKGYWFIQRQFVWVTPLYVVWLGWCWDSLVVLLQSGQLRFFRRQT